ncbi:MarR family winged helix-turn-helix transcriptional regulator [Paenibacillus pabuli]|uniref:DNA-binding MarR family transcriptional regulator n=2 Tax=Paenibacillus TaxID=44249 RepID=A0A855Y764_9BACL|nr:MarR family transcriptional regulator [Paenibacillus pabuli]PWW38918.1 DNA-binding MarR family transcriptional regulator [Paenibacillus pabuli]PXW06103.1 DNA-binding MarR family transcriptional regulator [Paenibacillus taichungensis]RAI89766.1 DNA-binding MarR family transcriptional regulator [Paenibacillus pabuli]
MDCSLEQETLLILLKNISNQLKPKFERCTGISSSRYVLLYHLYLHEEVTQSHLQKAIHIDSAAITRHLKQLETDGLVSRRKNPDDYRETFVRLTEQGLTHIANFKQDRNQFVHQMIQDFSDEEVAMMTDMLTRMQFNLKDL